MPAAKGEERSFPLQTQIYYQYIPEPILYISQCSLAYQSCILSSIPLHTLAYYPVYPCIPVLPDVGSMMVSPSFSSPLLSASSTIFSPMRSLTEPPALKNSHLATVRVRGRGRERRGGEEGEGRGRGGRGRVMKGHREF